MSDKKRKNMKSEERRAQLIEVAQSLFFEKGYEDTTMADILAAAGVSKGGFYHHFDSKDALFFGLLEHLVLQYQGALQAIASDSSMSPKDRLIAAIASEGQFLSQSNLGPQIQIIQVFSAEKNLGMAARFDREIRAMIRPIFAQLIEEGCEAGEFEVANAEAAADVIAHLIRSFDQPQAAALRARGTPQADAAAAHLQAVIDQQFLAADLVLGLPPGSTSYGFPEFVEAIMAVPVSDIG